jgi:Toprim domain-containing protein
MSTLVSDLARRLAEQAETVCRHYLPNGRRIGRYWAIGDARNTPGRSMFVRLHGPSSGKGAAGKWTDAATGEHGDLLDVIQEACGLLDFHSVVEEARRFLSLPHVSFEPKSKGLITPARVGSPESARRLFAMSQPIKGTIAETYLRKRSITALHELAALRFHPRCYYRPDRDAPAEVWPALIAAVTDLAGKITGAHRTWLDPSGNDKAPVDTPRRAMGHLLGHGVRFGIAPDVMAAGEGLETMLSLRSALPHLPLLAALSANHLSAVLFPAALRRLYVARDRDPAGDLAAVALTERAHSAGIEVLTLTPALGDFNEDLCQLGVDELCATLRAQLAPEDLPRFLGSKDTARAAT